MSTSWISRSILPLIWNDSMIKLLPMEQELFTYPERANDFFTGQDLWSPTWWCRFSSQLIQAQLWTTPVQTKGPGSIKPTEQKSLAKSRDAILQYPKQTIRFLTVQSWSTCTGIKFDSLIQSRHWATFSFKRFYLLALSSSWANR